MNFPVDVASELPVLTTVADMIYLCKLNMGDIHRQLEPYCMIPSTSIVLGGHALSWQHTFWQ